MDDGKTRTDEEEPDGSDDSGEAKQEKQTKKAINDPLRHGSTQVAVRRRRVTSA